MKLSGRPEARPVRREHTISPSARGAQIEDFHGPLQRLLEDALIGATVRARLRCSKPRRHSLPLSAPLHWERSYSALGAQRNRRGCCTSSLHWRAPRLKQSCCQPHAHKRCSKRRVFGSSSQIPHEFQDEPWLRTLTVKLSGRAQPHPARRGRTISFSARGAPPEDFHGPLQRWLERIFLALLEVADLL